MANNQIDLSTLSDEQLEAYKALLEGKQSKPIQQPSAFANAGIAPDVERNPVEKWFNQAAQDVRYGSKMTALGKVLAAMGATGTRSGVPEGVGSFMETPYTGVLRMGEGVSQLPQKPLQGAGNVVGGAMEAATIPSLLMPITSAPETAYAAASRALEDVPIPLKSRSAARFKDVLTKTKDVPIDVQPMEPIVEKAQMLGQTGSTLPKVLKDFIAAKENPIPYQMGREFASSAGTLSAAEKMATDPRMMAQVKRFADAISTANRDVAVSMGMGKQYDLAMKEYKMASQINRGAKAAAKYGASALGAGAAYELAKKYF